MPVVPIKVWIGFDDLFSFTITANTDIPTVDALTQIVDKLRTEGVSDLDERVVCFPVEPHASEAGKILELAINLQKVDAAHCNLLIAAAVDLFVSLLTLQIFDTEVYNALMCEIRHYFGDALQ